MGSKGEKGSGKGSTGKGGKDGSTAKDSGKGKGKGSKDSEKNNEGKGKGKGKEKSGKDKGGKASEEATAKGTGKKGKGSTEKKAAEFIKMADMTPDMVGVNLKVTVVSVTPRPSKGGKGAIAAEAIVGDETGIASISLTSEQAGLLKTGKGALIRNGYVTMLEKHNVGYIRLEVDKWGRIEAQEKGPRVNTSENLSEVEYELVEASPIH